MRTFGTILIVLLATAVVCHAAPAPPSTIWSVAFNVVDLTYNPVGQQLKLVGTSRSAILTDPANVQETEQDLWLELVIALYQDNSAGSIDAEFGPGYLRIGRDGDPHTLGTLLDVTLGRMKMASSTTFVQDALGAQSFFDVPAATGEWKARAFGPDARVDILGWQFAPGSLTGLSDLSDAPADADRVMMNIYFIPEPATMSLLAIGGVALIRRKRK